MRDIIIELLVTDGGYRRVAGPLRLVDTDFGTDFDAVLVGPEQQGCLVVVIDGGRIPIPVVVRRVKSFALVLDRSGSQRPLTVVLIASSSTGESIEALERQCRVIVITEDDDARSALRGLLPLKVEGHGKTLTVANDTLLAQIGSLSQKPLIDRLLKAAQRSAAEVEREILRAIEQATEHEESAKESGK